MSKIKNILNNENKLKGYTFLKIGFILGLLGIIYPISVGVHFEGELDLIIILFLFGIFIIFSLIPALILGGIGFLIGRLLDK